MTAVSGRTRAKLEERLNERAFEREAEEIVELELGGRLRFTPADFERTENRWDGETATPANPIVHETNTPTEYITVNYQNGNYEWFEFNFRVRNGVAYLGSKMKIKNPHNGHGWIPPEVEEAIQKYHPKIEVREEKPPWWE